MLNFYDFEVFKRDWMVVIINPIDKIEETIINDSERLANYYEAHRSEIFIGYNNVHYDQYIFKAILLGLDPKEVNDFIIKEGRKGWEFSNAFRNVPMNNYDVFNLKTDPGLKAHEAFMGNDIRETSVPFDIDRKLTDDEIRETVRYCTHDVEQTIEVFVHRRSEFNARIDLLRLFDLPLSMLSKTDAQLTSSILGAQKRNERETDEFDFEIIQACELGPYRYIADWYRDPDNHRYDSALDFDLAGTPHRCAWGGLHGAKLKYNSEGYFINMDVASYYPAMMIEYGWLSRNVTDPAQFKRMRDMRIEFKAAKDDRHKALKIPLNSTYGACKDKMNALYDPRQANNVCVNGQLMLIDLVYHLNAKCRAEIIQSNTDGVLVRMPDDFPGGEDAFFDAVDDVASEWEDRTKMQLEFDEYRRVFQKDVNNYVLVAHDGSYKSKGAYVKKLTPLDCDMAIVNDALIAYMHDGTPPEVTIGECNDPRQFQRVVKVSRKYECAMHNDNIVKDRVLRVFASADAEDGTIFKIKRVGDQRRYEKFANTSPHCFIENGNLNGCDIMGKIDRKWYIELAKTRLTQFGVMR